MRIRGLRLLSIVFAGPAAATAQPLQMVHAFEAPAATPIGGLVQTTDGSLYGTTAEGGAGGTIYRIPPGDGPLAIVARFDRGRYPDTALVRGADGALYGTTGVGGVSDFGTVFRFDPVLVRIETLHAFTGFAEGSVPQGPVLPAVDGRLYGMTSGTLYRIDPITGRTETLLALPRFGPLGDGPAGGLVQTPDGMLWGALRNGGGPGGGAYGTVIRVDPATAAAIVVHTFARTDGWMPTDLMRSADGWLYGTTIRGGAEDAGTIFRIDPATGGLESVYDMRPSNGTDGYGPSGLVEGPDGALYGTTGIGTTGIGDPPSTIGGTIFRLRRLPGGGHEFATLLTLDRATAGLGLSDLVATSDGWVYGPALGGGPSAGGTVFRFDALERGPSGNPLQFAVLHAFSKRGTGWYVSAPPVQGGDGALYGLTSLAGANGNGDVYRLNPATGSTTVLAPVPGPERIVGSAPSAFVDGGDGNLYAAVQNDDAGHVLRLVPATGTVTTVLSRPAADGRFVGGLFRAGSSIHVLVSATGITRLHRFDPASGTLTPGPTTPSGTFGDVAPPAGAHDGQAWLQVQNQVITGPFLGNFRWDLNLYRVDATSGATTLIDSESGSDPHLLTTPAEATGGLIYYAGFAADGPHVRSFDPATGSRATVCSVTARIGRVISLTGLPDGGVLAAFDISAYPAPGPARTELYRCRPGAAAIRVDAGTEGLGALSWFAPGPGGLLYGASAGGPRGGGMIVRLAAAGPTPPFDSEGDGLADEWERFFGLDPSSAAGADGPSGDPDGDGISNLAEQAAGTHPRGVVTQYLAEGATGTFFQTRLALANPGSDPAHVLVRFLTDLVSNGGPYVIRHQLDIPARARRTIDVGTLPGLASANFSTIVESDAAIAVDRTMTWDARGYGSHTESAVASPSPTWYLAEGSTSGDFELFYLLQNPNPATITATVRYLRPFGQPPVERQYTLAGQSRTTIYVDRDPELMSTDVSAVISAPSPIIVERAMYRSRPGQPFAAGHASAGVTAPALEWFLAEGATGAFFDLFVLVANPNPTPAVITAEYLRLGGGVFTKTYTVPASGRFTIWVDDETIPAGSGQKPLADAALSTTIRSTNGVPIIVERAMWWPGPALTPDYWYEAHNSPGATSSATRWVAPGGEVGGMAGAGADTYILIANPTTTPARVLVRLLFENGNTTGRYYDLPPKSRTNVPLGADFPEAIENGRAAAVVESLGATPVPIVVERATYASPEGIVWASGGNALATPLP